MTNIISLLKHGCALLCGAHTTVASTDKIMRMVGAFFARIAAQVFLVSHQLTRILTTVNPHHKQGHWRKHRAWPHGDDPADAADIHSTTWARGHLAHRGSTGVVAAAGGGVPARHARGGDDDIVAMFRGVVRDLCRPQVVGGRSGD